METLKPILAIDDEPALLQLFRTALSHRGYSVLTAADADAAMKHVEEQEVALVLIDVHLPGASGIEFYHSLRARQQTPVVFVTGDPSAIARAAGNGGGWDEDIAAGRAALLNKPFSLRTLFQEVESLIGPPPDRDRGPSEDEA